MKNFLHTLYSIYLCVKYPFLYPRNRWTGKHWQSWTLDEYLHGERYLWGPRDLECKKDGIWDKAFVWEKDPNGKYGFETIRKTISYPWAMWYYIVYFIANYFLPIFHCIPTYTELDGMDAGWRKAFGIQMCDELKKQLKKEHYLYRYRITDIKEKWGELRWYDEGHSKEVDLILQKYTNMSEVTCICCGKKATRRTTGWISPYCDDCCPNEKYEVIE